MHRLVTTFVLTVFLALATAGPALAACTTHTYRLHGRLVMCTTCCSGNHCQTTCF